MTCNHKSSMQTLHSFHRQNFDTTWCILPYLVWLNLHYKWKHLTVNDACAVWFGISYLFLSYKIKDFVFHCLHCDFLSEASLVWFLNALFLTIDIQSTVFSYSISFRRQCLYFKLFCCGLYSHPLRKLLKIYVSGSGIFFFTLKVLLWSSRSGPSQ